MKNRPSPTNRRLSGDALLKIANRAGTQLRQADNLILFKLKFRAQLNAIPNLKDMNEKVSALLKLTQTQRDARQDGNQDGKEASFAIIFGAAEYLADELMEQDSVRQDLLKKLWAIEERFKMDEDGPSEGDRGYAEWKVVWDQIDRRRDQNTAAILRRYGEGDMADFFLNERDAFNHRIDTAFGPPAGDDWKKGSWGRAMAGKLLRDVVAGFDQWSKNYQPEEQPKKPGDTPT